MVFQRTFSRARFCRAALVSTGPNKSGYSVALARPKRKNADLTKRNGNFPKWDAEFGWTIYVLDVEVQKRRYKAIIWLLLIWQTLQHRNHVSGVRTAAVSG